MQICGKPDGTFFRAGLSSLGLSAESVVMVGDDIVSDVGGAQAAGIRGIQVRMVTMVTTVTMVRMVTLVTMVRVVIMVTMVRCEDVTMLVCR